MDVHLGMIVGPVMILAIGALIFSLCGKSEERMIADAMRDAWKYRTPDYSGAFGAVSTHCAMATHSADRNRKRKGMA